ncbi:MAG: NAD-dependent malic enzyme [Actinomycetia bacterium]|nr:NAD-dependent malic enzyme [Actinomycetes bacterium]
MASPLSGRELLAKRHLSKSTAFTTDERDELGLHGLLPPVVETLDQQVERLWVEYGAKTTDLERHVFLRALEERNSVQFYAFLAQDLEALIPIIYTPTVGVACQQWSRIYRCEHGLFLSWPQRDRVAELLDNAVGDREIDVAVVTDGERILGLGDLGVGGMGIPIGKLALYTAAGGIDPARCLPVFLDMGTNNEALLSDPLYLGWRHQRIRGEDYDELVDAFIDAFHKRCPNALLQWEDFAQANATRLLDRHRDTICSFNDDIQGTAAVTLASIVAGLRITDVPLSEMRVVIVGAGSAGTGIGEQIVRALLDAGLTEAEARDRCWLVDRDGLLHDQASNLLPFQKPFARPWSEVASWDENGDGEIDLLEVVQNTHPHALVGVTGQPGLFTEAVVRAQAAGVERPIVLPLSNPTPRAEAIPTDIVAWTEGRAVVGTGSPFEPVVRGTERHHISQVNNVYVFPGVGLGTVVAGARIVSDMMLTAAAAAIGDLAIDPTPRERETDRMGAGESRRLLPPIEQASEVATHVARAVARAAIDEGLAPPQTDAEIAAAIEQFRWQPRYTPAK